MWNDTKYKVTYLFTAARQLSWHAIAIRFGVWQGTVASGTAYKRSYWEDAVQIEVLECDR